MKHKRLVAVGTFIALAAMVGGIVWWLVSGDKESTESASHASSATSQSVQQTTPTIPPPNVTQLVQVLSGEDKAAQAELLLPEYRDADWIAEDVVPEGMAISIDPKTSVSSGVYGQLVANLRHSDGRSQTYVIHMENRGGQWFILTFEEV
jgi:hypothetical protein